MNFAAPGWVSEDAGHYRHAEGDWRPYDPFVGLGYSKHREQTHSKMYGLFHIPGYSFERIEPFDQIQHIVDTLAEAPFSHRAVASTAFPPADATCDDPPCLRELWMRGYEDEDEGVLKVDAHTHWRSNDAWGASLFNMFALTELQRDICSRLQEKLGRQVRAGAYVHTADSYHIYGNDMKDFQDKFLTSLELPESRRFWDLSTPTMAELMAEGEVKERRLAAQRGSE